MPAAACYRMYMVRIAISSVAQRSPVLFQLLVDRIALLGEGSDCEVLGIFLEVDEDIDRAAADEDDAGFGIGIRLPPVEAQSEALAAVFQCQQCRSLPVGGIGWWQRLVVLGLQVD